MIGRALAALGALVLLAGCGSFGAGGEEGTATLWVTRDRGAQVLLDVKVDAGQTLMRALDSKVELETRYGGRFVQAIDGLSGSLEDQRDWFWFVNGYEGDRSASSYRLRDGDVAWLDYRGWQREGEARVVVGAFPSRPCTATTGRRVPAVRYEGSRTRAEELARTIGAGWSSRSAPLPPTGRTCSSSVAGATARLPSCSARRRRSVQARAQRRSWLTRRYEVR